VKYKVVMLAKVALLPLIVPATADDGADVLVLHV
jgi:hypothetical protein